MTVDLVASILRVVRLAIEVDRNICRSRDRDGMGRPFFGAESAGEKKMAVAGVGPRNLIYRHAVRQDDVHARKPSPAGCRGGRDGCNCRGIRRARRLAKSSRHRGVGRQMQGVDDGRLQRAGESYGRCIEGVIVDDVVANLLDHIEDRAEGGVSGMAVGRRRAARSV